MSEQPTTTAPAIGVILVAAGSGTRLGANEPKAFVKVAGETILARALRSIFGIAEPAHIVVVAPVDRVDDARQIVRAVAGETSVVSVVVGGDTRQQSVAAGIAALPASVDTVLVHDAARSLTPPALFDAVIANVRESGKGIIPGLPVADTIKQVDWMNSVERTVDRAPLVAVQTPQGFPRAMITEAYAAADHDFTDDAALVAAAGFAVTVIDGDPLAFKITTPWDLARAESLTTATPEPGPGPYAEAHSVAAHPAVEPQWRTGVGVDVHAFAADEPLWLGGLYWPDEVGLAGHSDGDAVAHAVCDALLSAAGLGDIGGRFGTDDAQFAGAHGEVFIRATVELLAGAGFSVGNVAVQVIGNTPKLAPRRAEVESRMSDLVGAPVSVSATTTDALGFAGRGEGLTAIATALVTRVG